MKVGFNLFITVPFYTPRGEQEVCEVVAEQDVRLEGQVVDLASCTAVVAGAVGCQQPPPGHGMRGAPSSIAAPVLSVGGLAGLSAVPASFVTAFEALEVLGECAGLAAVHTPFLGPAMGQFSRSSKRYSVS